MYHWLIRRKITKLESSEIDIRICNYVKSEILQFQIHEERDNFRNNLRTKVSLWRWVGDGGSHLGLSYI